MQLVTIKVDDYVTCEFTWIHVDSCEFTFEYQRVPDWTTFSFFFLTVNQETNTSRSPGRGDQENIFGRPRPNVSHLRRPGAVRAQPWFVAISKATSESKLQYHKIIFSLFSLPISLKVLESCLEFIVLLKSKLRLEVRNLRLTPRVLKLVCFPRKFWNFKALKCDFECSGD